MFEAKSLYTIGCMLVYIWLNACVQLITVSFEVTLEGVNVVLVKCFKTATINVYGSLFSTM